MGYVLIAGVGPLPPQRPPRQMAPGLRLWSLARIAARSSCEGRIFSCDHFGHLPEVANGSQTESNERFTIIHSARDGWEATLRAQIQADPPAAVVATTDLVGAALARMLPRQTPLWVDLYGDPVAEGQLIATKHAHDGGLAPLAANMLAILSRADRLSGCSRAHRHALLGQLGLAGRLNASMAHRDLVSVIPGLLVVEAAEAGPPPDDLALPGDAFAVLWSGGFNTWTDEETLFRGLAQAMERDGRIHFICVGGGIDRHNPGTYAEFEARVRQSPLRERFHLLGWRSQGEALALTARMDAAINIDAPSHEAELGTRTRLLEWAAAEVPIVSTLNSEIAQDLASAGGVREFRAGDARGLAEALAALSADRPGGKAMAKRAREHVMAHWTPESAGEDLVEWLNRPQRAPDRAEDHRAEGTNRLARWMRGLEPAMRADAEPADDLESDLRDLRSLRGSRLIRWANRLRRGNR